MVEGEVKNIINTDSFTTQLLADYQGFHSPYFIGNEIQIENGITVDHVIFNQTNGNAIALIESKGGDIGITEFLRGIGQVMQYQQHIAKKKVLTYDQKCYSYLAFPEELFQRFDITKLAFPLNIKLLVINSKNNAPLVMDPQTLRGTETINPNLIRISPYYVRDNRLGELYIGLLELRRRSLNVPFAQRINRNFDEIAKECGFPNPGNARNIGISLASLGLIDSFNRPTTTGYDLSVKPYGAFVNELLDNYLYPYINTIFRALLNISMKKNSLEITWEELRNEIKNIWGGKDIMFLTQSGTRYISSWMSILRDDVSAIDFSPRTKEKNIEILELPIKGTPNKLKSSGSLLIPQYVTKYLENNKLL